MTIKIYDNDQEVFVTLSQLLKILLTCMFVDRLFITIFTLGMLEVLLLLTRFAAILNTVATKVNLYF